MREKVKLRVPGSTSNLGSGFDTFGLALQLYLHVEIEVGQSPGIAIAGEGADEIPTNDDNLIIKSVRLFCNKFNLRLPALRITVRNEIPLQRGLGSSGAATLAGLMSAAVISETNVDNQTMLHIAAEMEGHPENAAASLLGGLTINVQSDSVLITKKVHVDDQLKAILFIPEKRISTGEARKILPDKIPHREAVFNTQRSALLAHAFLTQDYDALRTAMQDLLHQPFRKKLIPGFDMLAAAGYDSDALGVCISGSGSAVLAIAFEEEVSAVKQAWQSIIREGAVAGRVTQVGFENTGASLLPT